MTQAKHTPGPWYVDQDDRPGMQWNRHIYSQPADRAVCFMAHSDGKDQARDKANADLIAAAPELLEALRGLLPQTFTGNPTQAELTAHWERERDMGNGMAPFVLAAYAAIAKAEGQS